MRKLAIAAVAIAIVPGLLLSQADSSRGRGRTVRSSSGSIGRRMRGNYGLSQDQISQLQTALQQANCNPGPIDGVLGPRTRSAMACARQKNNITGTNPNDLFRSLNLGFTAPDSTGGMMRSGRRTGGRTGADTTMSNMNTSNDTSMTRAGHRRGTRRSGRDTTMRRRMRPDSSARPGITPRPGTPARPDTTRRP